jgi:hypothetical protein
MRSMRSMRGGFVYVHVCICFQTRFERDNKQCEIGQLRLSLQLCRPNIDARSKTSFCSAAMYIG